MTEAAEYQRAMPHPWAVHDADSDTLVGFAMISDNIPQPIDEDLVGPYFLWKLLIDHRHQGKGYGQEVMRQIVELVRGQGATELLTSHVTGEGGPAGFYARLGFVPTGEKAPTARPGTGSFPLLGAIRVRSVQSVASSCSCSCNCSCSCSCS